MTKLFDVGLVVGGEEGASPEQLRIALREMMARAVRVSPDHRFDWRNVDISVATYDGAKTPRG